MLQSSKHNTLSQGGGASEYSPIAFGANFSLDVFVKKFRFLQDFFIYCFTPQKAFTLAEGATHVETSAKKCAHAFTLAEVLITLGIIGIVAAMTLPALTTKYRKQEISARLKKFYTIMNQAIAMSEIENGDIQYWQIERTFKAPDGSYDYNVGSQNSLNFFNRYLAKYIKYHHISQGYSKENEDGTTSNEFNKIYFFDGSSAQLKQGTCQDFIFDINGDKKPNERGYDQFYFLICPSGSSHKLYKNEKFSAYSSAKNREDALTKCKLDASYCGKLIQIDGWEIKNDYPYKI